METLYDARHSNAWSDLRAGRGSEEADLELGRPASGERRARHGRSHSCVACAATLQYAAPRTLRRARLDLGCGGNLRRDVLLLVMRDGAKIALFGIASGIAGALALTHLMVSLLFEVKPTDPTTFAGVAILLAFVVLAACYIPACRAMRVDPMVALRYE